MRADRIPAIRWRFFLPSLFDCRRELVRHARYKAICPFHDDKRPSMFVYLDKRHGWSWHCFGCGERGDAIDAVRRLNDCGVDAAIEYLLDSGDVDGLAFIGAPKPSHRYELHCDVPGCTSTRALETELDAAWALAGGTGWEVAPDGIGAICPPCQSTAHQRIAQ